MSLLRSPLPRPPRSTRYSLHLPCSPAPQPFLPGCLVPSLFIAQVIVRCTSPPVTSQDIPASFSCHTFLQFLWILRSFLSSQNFPPSTSHTMSLCCTQTRRYFTRSIPSSNLPRSFSAFSSLHWLPPGRPHSCHGGLVIVVIILEFYSALLFLDQLLLDLRTSSSLICPLVG